jgi:hypothetical protein
MMKPQTPANSLVARVWRQDTLWEEQSSGGGKRQQKLETLFLKVLELMGTFVN